jgi:hypothetical protein
MAPYTAPPAAPGPGRSQDRHAPGPAQDAATAPLHGRASRTIWLVPLLAGAVSLYPGLAGLAGRDPLGELLASCLTSTPAADPIRLDPEGFGPERPGQSWPTAPMPDPTPAPTSGT